MSRFDELAKTEVAWRESEAQRERRPAKHTISALVAAFQPDHTSSFATRRDRNGDVLPEPGRRPDDIVRAEHAWRFKRDPYRRRKAP
jgi:hypothetical protein